MVKFSALVNFSSLRLIASINSSPALATVRRSNPFPPLKSAAGERLDLEDEDGNWGLYVRERSEEGEEEERDGLQSWRGGEGGTINTAKRFSWWNIIKVILSRLPSGIIESFYELTDTKTAKPWEKVEEGGLTFPLIPRQTALILGPLGDQERVVMTSGSQEIVRMGENLKHKTIKTSITDSLANIISCVILICVGIFGIIWWWDDQAQRG